MSSPSEQTLLVTGANGFVALHIVRESLEKGYYVRGTVRSESSIAKIRDTFSQYADKLSLVVVPDITVPENYAPAFANPVKPITGVHSIAAPFTLKVEDNARDLLDPAVAGAVSILEAARKYGPEARRVVHISSFAAINFLLKGARPGYTYTEKDWNDMSYEEAAQSNGVIAYCTSKALAEKAQWAWVEREKPQFTLAAINPPWVFGPHVAPLAGTERLNESSALIWGLYDAKEVPAFDFGGFADVRDVAAAHIQAFERPEAGGQRFLVGSNFSYQTAVDLLREELPQLDAHLPKGNPGKPEPAYDIDGSKAKQILGLEYTPLAKTMKDSFVQLLEAHERSSA